MTAKILDGSAVSKQILAEIKDQTSVFQAEWKAAPTLALIRVGDDPASVSYAGMIERTCKQVGIGLSKPIPCPRTRARTRWSADAQAERRRERARHHPAAAAARRHPRRGRR